MSKGPHIDLIYTFRGNPRSEKISDQLCHLMEEKPGLTDKPVLMTVVSQNTPALQEALEILGGLHGTVALVDSDLSPRKKHLRFVPGRPHRTNGLPDWASAARYVVKVGRSCNNTERSAQQILAIFVAKYQDRLTKYPLPWGSAEDPEAKKRREEKERSRKRGQKRNRHLDSSLSA